MSSFWDTEELVGTVSRTDKNEEIRVRRVSKDGREYIDVRTFYLDKRHEVMRPGKGIAIPEPLAAVTIRFMREALGAGEDDES